MCEYENRFDELNEQEELEMEQLHSVSQLNASQTQPGARLVSTSPQSEEDAGQTSSESPRASNGDKAEQIMTNTDDVDLLLGTFDSEVQSAE